MSFDLAASLRRIGVGKRTTPLKRRSDNDLPFILSPVSAGPALLLDTCVYIDVLQGRAPSAVENLLAARQINHSSIAVAELAHLFGRLDPAHPGTAAIWATIRQTIAAIPSHRLGAPSIQAGIEAGIVTGMIARLASVAKTDRQPLLNDATLFLQALEGGMILLSRNVTDMDRIGQLVPAGRMLLYRALP